MKKKIVFLLNGKKCVDLDAKLPLAYGFQKRGYEVVFLAWGTLSKDPSKLTQIDKLLSKKRLQIYTLDRILGLEKMTALIHKLYPYKEKLTFFHRVIYKSFQFLAYCFSARLKSKIQSIYNEALFVSAISTHDNVYSNKGEQLSYQLALQPTTFFIGLPTVVWPHYYLEQVLPFDAFIVNSMNEKRELQNQHEFQGEVIAEGCPSFEKSYIERFNTTNNVSRFAQKEKTILLIMVSRHNTFNQYSPVIEIFKKFIQNAIQQEYTVVVKYHPADMHDDFAEFRSNKYFKETKFPIESLVHSVGFAVTLFSTAILKTVALDVPSYYLINKDLRLLYKKNSQSINAVYFKDTKTLKSTWIDDYCTPIENFEQFTERTNKELTHLKKKNFIRDFHAEGALERTVDNIIELCQNP